MKKLSRLVLSATAVVALAGLCGCSWFGSSTPDPTTLSIAITGSRQLNLDSQSQSAPVVLRFYQLAGTDKFMSTDFFTLLDNGTRALGGDVVATKEYEVRPGETLTYTDPKVADSVHFIGVMGAFRDATNATTWRATVPIVSNRDNKLVASVDLSSVTLQPATSRSWWKFF